MGLQAEWNGMRFEVAPGNVRPIGSLSTTRGVSVERNQDKEGEPATQTVALDLMTLDVSYTAVQSATGENPRGTYGTWWRYVGTYAPFFLGGRKFMADLFMLKSCNMSDAVVDGRGEIVSCTIELSFEEYAEDESGLKTEKTVISGLTPGVMTASAASALSVGPTEAQRQGKMPTNPGM